MTQESTKQKGLSPEGKSKEPSLHDKTELPNF